MKKLEDQFTKSEWEHAIWTEAGKCKTCMQKKPKNMWPCSGCSKVKDVPDDFSEWLKNRKSTQYAAGARCNDCKSRLDEDKEAQWRKAGVSVTKVSATKLETLWPCSGCSQVKRVPDEFSEWLKKWKRKSILKMYAAMIARMRLAHG